MVDEDRDDEDCNEDRWEVEVIYATGQGRAEQSRTEQRQPNDHKHQWQWQSKIIFNQSMNDNKECSSGSLCLVSSQLISHLALRLVSQAIGPSLSVCPFVWSPSSVSLVCFFLFFLILIFFFLFSFFSFILFFVPFRFVFPLVLGSCMYCTPESACDRYISHSG